MGFLDKFKNSFVFGTGGGYDAISKKGNRKSLSTVNGAHEAHLSESERRTAIANTRDLRRNFAVASWAIRKHLDYVSDFKFKPVTGDAELDKFLSDSVKIWSNKTNFDQAERHGLSESLRLLEASRAVDGDVFAYKLRNGKLQFIEADRVADMKGRDGEKLPDNKKWCQGFLINTNTGRTEKIRVGKRSNGNRTTFLRDINWRDIIPLGYYERFDQVRGISPLMSAMTTFQDNNEGFGYALQKMKVEQLFGVAFTRSGDDAIGELSGGTLSDGAGGEVEDRAGYDVDLGGGPLQFDLEVGEDVKFLNSSNPSAETQAFLLMTVELAIKALDLPPNFYDESRANFAGSRGAMHNYQRSVNAKQAQIIEWLNEWTRFKIQWAIAQGNETFINRINDIKWEWIGCGIPWWDTAKEAKGQAMMIAMGLNNPQMAAREIGSDFYENIDEIAKAQEYAEQMGVRFTLPNIKADDSNLEGSQTEQEERK